MRCASPASLRRCSVCLSSGWCADIIEGNRGPNREGQSMLIIDAQVHAYERNHPGRPWHKVLTGPPEVTGDQMVAAMDAVGVDGAILVSPFTMYRYDASYALEVKKRHPGRFALIKAVDPTNPAIADVIAEWKRAPDAVAVRMLLVRGGYTEDPADPGLNRVLAEAARLSLPVNLHIAGRLDQGIELIRRHGDTQNHCRSSRSGSATRAAATGGALGGTAESADAGKTPARRHQDQRRLRPVA